MYTSDDFFSWIFGIIKSVNFLDFGTNYLVVIGIVLITAILISPRKLSNVKVLALPLMIGYSIIGLNIPLMFMVLAGIFFVMETLSTKGIGDMIEAVSQKVSEIRGLPVQIREKRLSKMEKNISTARRENAVREAEKSKIIPFRKGTSISDVMDIMSRDERKKILKMKSQSKRDRAIDSYFKKLKDKERFWEVDE